MYYLGYNFFNLKIIIIIIIMMMMMMMITMIPSVVADDEHVVERLLPVATLTHPSHCIVSLPRHALYAVRADI